MEEGLGGTITSVNFPNNYEDNTDCSFTILPVPGNHVTLQVNLILHHQDIPNNQRTNLGVLIIHEDIATLYVNCPISALVVMTMIVATKK